MGDDLVTKERRVEWKMRSDGGVEHEMILRTNIAVVNVTASNEQRVIFQFECAYTNEHIAAIREGKAQPVVHQLSFKMEHAEEYAEDILGMISKAKALATVTTN